MTQIQRPDYDPAFKRNFIKTGVVDIRETPRFNEKTNFYDYLRIANDEAAAPDARGYDSLPKMAGRRDVFKSRIDRLKEKAAKIKKALSTQIKLPLLDQSGDIVINPSTGRIAEKKYLFSEVVGGHSSLKKYALQYLMSMTETEIMEQPEYIIMVEMLRDMTAIDPMIRDFLKGYPELRETPGAAPVVDDVKEPEVEHEDAEEYFDDEEGDETVDDDVEDEEGYEMDLRDFEKEKAANEKVDSFSSFFESLKKKSRA